MHHLVLLVMGLTVVQKKKKVETKTVRPTTVWLRCFTTRFPADLLEGYLLEADEGKLDGARWAHRQALAHILLLKQDIRRHVVVTVALHLRAREERRDESMLS